MNPSILLPHTSPPESGETCLTTFNFKYLRHSHIWSESSSLHSRRASLQLLALAAFLRMVWLHFYFLHHFNDTRSTDLFRTGLHKCDSHSSSLTFLQWNSRDLLLAAAATHAADGAPVVYYSSTNYCFSFKCFHAAVVLPVQQCFDSYSLLLVSACMSVAFLKTEKKKSEFRVHGYTFQQQHLPVKPIRKTQAYKLPPQWRFE